LGTINLPSLDPITFASHAVNAASKNFGAAVGDRTSPHVGNSTGSGLIIAPSIDEEDSREEVSPHLSCYALCYEMSNCYVTSHSFLAHCSL
jgi:hypothetical protein